MFATMVLPTPQANGNLAQHHRQFLWSWTVEAIDATSGNFEEQRSLVDLRTLKDAVNACFSYTLFDHSSAVQRTEDLCCRLEPLAHPWTPVPESAGAQIRQEITDVEGSICQAEAIKVYHKDVLTMEEQLAGLEATVCRSIDIWLQRL